VTTTSRYALCAMRYALCAMRHAPCAMRHAPCAMRHAPCAIQLFGSQLDSGPFVADQARTRPNEQRSHALA
jgi:hypothetical protein